MSLCLNSLLAWEQSLGAGRKEEREEVEKVVEEEKHNLEELKLLGTADSIPADFFFFIYTSICGCLINTYGGPLLTCQ